MKKNPFREYFYFQKSDRRAIVAIGSIAVFAIGVQLVVDALKTKETVETRAVLEDRELLGSSVEKSLQSVTIHVFDPNTVDSLTLVGFGIKAWKVKNFLHYRAAGKVFRSAKDLGDTYGWTEEDVHLLAPYVQVGEAYQQRKEMPRYEKKETRNSKSLSQTKKFQTLTLVDVNEADTTLLRRIPGVGEKISEAIVRYRQQLGGYYSVEQLLEISIVSPELLEWFTISSPTAVQKMNLNQASFQALNSHPYISYEQTKSLLQYIRLYGEVKDEATLLSIGIFTKEELERLRPYVAYE